MAAAMGRILLDLRVYVLTTSNARFKHFISDRVQRTWCDSINYRQAASIVSLYDFAGVDLPDDLRDDICPRCLRYYDWLDRNSVKVKN